MPFRERKKQVPVYNMGGNQIGYALINDTRRRWRALGAWVLIFTLATFWGLHMSRTNSTNNKQAISALADAQTKLEAASVDINDLQKVVTRLRAEQQNSCTNYETLRDATNLFHRTLDGFLATAQRAREDAYKRDGNASDKRAAEVYKQLRAGLTQVKADCAQRITPTPAKP